MSSVVEINNINEEESFIRNNKLAIIFFGSKSCGHCASITPIYNKLSNKYKGIKFGHIESSKIKVDNLQFVPTFVVYQNSNPIDKLEGASEKSLTSLIESL